MGDDKYIIQSLTDSLLKSDIEYFQNSCLSSPKLRTYVNIVDFNHENVYLYKPLSITQKSNLAKFRLGSLPLRIETDRYCRPVIPENERICKQCSLNIFEGVKPVENEIHFTLHCKKHDLLRKSLFNKIGWPQTELTDNEILKVLTSEPNLVKIFSQYIGDCYHNRVV